MKKLLYFIALVVISTSCIDVKDYGQTPENVNLDQEASKLLLQSTKDTTTTYIYENPKEGDVIIIYKGEIKGKYILANQHYKAQRDVFISVLTTICVMTILTFAIYVLEHD